MTPTGILAKPHYLRARKLVGSESSPTARKPNLVMLLMKSPREVSKWVRRGVRAGRQAYIVYTVIGGAKDDQPELDFAHDETGYGVRGAGDEGVQAEVLHASAGKRTPGSSTALRSAPDDKSTKG